MKIPLDKGWIAITDFMYVKKIIKSIILCQQSISHWQPKSTVLETFCQYQQTNELEEAEFGYRKAVEFMKLETWLFWSISSNS
jgi:hypothetical protein